MDNHQLKTNNSSNNDLTEDQRIKIKENREKALAIRQKRAAAVTKKSGEINKKQTRKDVKKTKLIDTGGGFLLDPEDAEKSKREIKIIEKPPPILPPNQPKCMECNKNFGQSYLLDTFEYAVCDECRDPDGKHSLITKTTAKKDYLLTDVDLEQRGSPLKFVLNKNPHNSFWSSMKLYLLPQVEQRALEIWGSEEKLLQQLEDRDEKRTKMKHKAFNKQLKTLRMSVRSSLYTQQVSASHEHQFSDEIYNEDDDMYESTCKTCGFKNTYEKM